MSQYTEQDEEDEPKHLCWLCVGEPFLKAEIKRDGQPATCSYCAKTENCFTIGEVAGRIETAFEHHYQITPEEPNGYERAMIKEGDLYWERAGEPFSMAVQNAAIVDEEPADDIVSMICERHYDHDLAKAGERGFFDDDNFYEEKDPDDIEFREDWRLFEETLTKESRFFSASAQAALDKIFAELWTHRLHDDSSVIVEAGPDQLIGAFYRGRAFQSERKLEEAMTRPDLHIGPPPSEMALAGRMNAHGISMFYGATTMAVVVAEVRPPVGGYVLAGQFQLTHNVRLLNVEALSNINVTGSIFDPSFIGRLERAKFLRYIRARISRVIMPDDQPFEYIVTQAIADYLANRHDLALDGILYPSAQSSEKGMNVVLFQKASRVENMDLPEGTTLRSDLYSGSDAGPYFDPTVIEETPPKAAEKKATEKDARMDFGLILEKQIRADPDRRPVTLKLDVKSVTVHEVAKVKYETTAHEVVRHRWEANRDPF